MSRKPSDTTPGPGTVFGPYTLHEAVGMGGMASVFRATRDDGQVAAVKILHPTSLQDEDVRRFSREFATLSGLSHDNVIRVYESGYLGAFPWIAMEYVEGSDLAAVAKTWDHPVSPAKMPVIEGLLRALCSGLDYIHERGLIHRDLKPANVLMTADGVPKISDFGVVKDATAAGTALTVVGKLIGTVAFMAPEQITNEEVDARTDLYSLGAMLFYLLTGRRPIEADSVAGYLARHLTEVPKTANHYNPEVPPRLSHLCARLLAKDPTERPASAKAVLAMLDAPDAVTGPPLRARDAAIQAAVQALKSEDPTIIAYVGPPGSGRSALLNELERVAIAAGRRVLRWSHTTSTPVGTAQVVLIDNAERLAADAVDGLTEERRQARIQNRPFTVFAAGTTARGAISVLTDDMGLPEPILGLGPLDRADVIGMMRDRGLAGPVAPALGRRLHAEFAGQPGPIAAQVHALIQAGWLTEHTPGRFKAAKPLDEIRNAELPVPPAVRARIQTLLSSLDPPSLHACHILAVLGRPVEEDLLTRAMPDHPAHVATQRLIDRGLLIKETNTDRGTVRFAHPSAAIVVRSRMDESAIQDASRALASVLQQRRRRADAEEIATLYAQAGDDAKAYPYFVRAARRASRDGRFVDVVRLTQRAQAIQRSAENRLDSDTIIRLRRWVYLIAGEAQLARGHWALAIPPLVNAVAAARLEGDAPATARALTSLGRAHYRSADFDAARPILEEANALFEPGDPMRGTATRALADIRLRDCDIRGAEALWTDALDSARATGSSDSESRAIRGLANVRALQNRLDAAASLLESALDRLERGGDVRVRCGVLARAIELDLAAGRLGAANHRSERLLDAIEQHELVDRIADARALHAIVLIDSGRPIEAAQAANIALTYAQMQGEAAWNTRLRVARALLAAGRPDAAATALPMPDRVPENRLDDPPGQLAAIRARLLAASDPVAAKDLAMWAMMRPEPLLALRSFRIRVDASRALSAVGAIDHAREGAKRAVRLLDAAGTEGFRLDGLLALNQAADDPRVADAIGQLARRIADRLPPTIAKTFRTRPDLVALNCFR
jgi:tetratricopeptide (TPR) repeat protein